MAFNNMNSAKTKSSQPGHSRVSMLRRQGLRLTSVVDNNQPADASTSSKSIQLGKNEGITRMRSQSETFDEEDDGGNISVIESISANLGKSLTLPPGFQSSLERSRGSNESRPFTAGAIESSHKSSSSSAVLGLPGGLAQTAAQTTKYFGVESRIQFFERYQWMNRQRKIQQSEGSEVTDRLYFNNEDHLDEVENASAHIGKLNQ